MAHQSSITHAQNSPEPQNRPFPSLLFSIAFPLTHPFRAPPPANFQFSVFSSQFSVNPSAPFPHFNL